MPSTMRRRVKSWRTGGKHPVVVRIVGAVYRQVKELRVLVALPFVLVQMRRTRPVRDPEALLTLAYDGFGRTITPLQVRKEISGLTHAVSTQKPKRLLEIGTARGGTLFLLTRSAADDAHVLSVDLPGGWFGGGYPWWKRVLYRAFARPGQRLDLIRADSHSQETVERVKRMLGGELLDFLMIDGDHTYEGVKRDFESYAPLVRPGGVVALHDIVPNRVETTSQVDRFWREVKDGRSVKELVADWDQSWAGIGVIRV